jgi:hypothetical protein
VALANAGASSEWMAQGYRLYGKALCQLRSALQDPVLVLSDNTLAAILLMGVFEAIFPTIRACIALLLTSCPFK